MNIVKKIGMYVPVFLLTMCGLAAMLVLSARIPRTALQAHMRDSAEYLSRYDKSYRLIKGADISRLDRNADAIWLSIAYGYDSKKPVSSVLWSKYYGRAGTEPKDAFLVQTRQGLKGNQEYLRYWHGGNAFIRLFHLVTDIRGIYLFHGLLIGLILLGIMMVLYRNGMAEVGVSFCISLAFVGIWVVPFCLEYSFVILWALFMTCVMIGKCLKGEWEKNNDFFD